jgi:hypothetical protein
VLTFYEGKMTAAPAPVRAGFVDRDIWDFAANGYNRDEWPERLLRGRKAANIRQIEGVPTQIGGACYALRLIEL